MAFSRPAHPRVTHTVSPLRELEKHMKNFICFSLTVTLALLLVSCATPQGELASTDSQSDDQRARDVLIEFLQSLHNSEYDKAAQLYAGTYETMRDHNPSTNPDDHVALLRNACTINGAQCLQVKSAALDQKVSNTEFVFRVEFLNGDGTLFVLGPCCGGNETDFPPQSVFYLTVVKTDKDNYVVMDMPPYAP
jgi:hypothetical protein